jgi:hypothetical protein
MLNASWATLLRQIPAAQQNSLMVRTCNGTEITVQNLLRIDFEFVIFKGRLSGSQDAGFLFILPYENVDYFGINRAVKDEEYEAIFGSLSLPDPGAAVASPPPAQLQALPPQPQALPAQPQEAVVVLSPPNGRPGTAVKSSVLERFRTRNTFAATAFRHPAE